MPHQRAALDGRDPATAEVLGVIQRLRDSLPELDGAALEALGVAVLEWCSACYQLGKAARRVRRRDFEAGRRLGKAEAEEEHARQAWMVPLLAAVSSEPDPS